jgi:hypothetical protein
MCVPLEQAASAATQARRVSLFMVFLGELGWPECTPGD